MGMQAGLTERQAWMTNPGRILDLYRWRMSYDLAMHGRRLKKETDVDEEGD